MSKQNFADETFEVIEESDFNPDIVRDGVYATYTVGREEGFQKGAFVTGGLFLTVMGAVTLAFKYALRKGKKEREEETKEAKQQVEEEA